MTQQSGDKDTSNLVAIKRGRKESKLDKTVEYTANLQRLKDVIIGKYKLQCNVVACNNISHVNDNCGL